MASQTRDVLLNFKPYVDEKSSKAQKQLASLVEKGIEAQVNQNIKAIKEVEAELMKLRKIDGEVEIDVEYNIVGDGAGGLKQLKNVSGKLFKELSAEIAKSEKYTSGFTGELKRGMQAAGEKIDKTTAKIIKQSEALDMARKKNEAFKAAGINPAAPGVQGGGGGDSDLAKSEQRVNTMNQLLARQQQEQAKIITNFARFAPPAAVQATLSEINQRISQTEKRIKKSATEMKAWKTSAQKASNAFKSGKIVEGFNQIKLAATGAFDNIAMAGTKANPALKGLRVQQAALIKGSSKMGGIGKSLAGIGAAAQAAFGPLTAIAAAIAAIMGVVSQLTNRQKQLQGLMLTLDGVGVSMANQEKVLAKSRNIALTYGVSLVKIEKAFKRLTPAILEAGGSLDNASEAIEGISARTTMLGLNTEQSGRYIEAFAQVMGKGKLQSEELNQQFAELDGGLRGQLQNWLALNKGITDFEGAMKKGEITSVMFLEAFRGINDEIITKFKKNIDSVQTSLDKLGEKGGMTLAQFQGKMQALTSIGLDEVGKALGPLGKELAKIYAAFVQIFTRMATEMPGLQKLVQWIGDFLGRVLKVGLVSILGLVHALAQGIDLLARGFEFLYETAKKIPLIGDAIKLAEWAVNGLNKSFDATVDASARLSDETKGVGVQFNSLESDILAIESKMANLKDIGKRTTPEYKELADELARLKKELGEKGAKELNNKLKQQKILAEAKIKELENDLSAAQKVEDAQRKKVDLIVKGLNWQLDAQQKVVEEAIEGIEQERDAYKDMIKKKIDGLRREGEMKKRAFRDAKKALKDEAKASQRTYEDRKDAINKAFDAEKRSIDRAKDAVDRKYEAEKADIDTAKDAVDKKYDAEMAEIGRAKDAVERKADAELAGIDRAKDAVEASYEAQTAKIDEAREAVEENYEAAIKGIENARKSAEAAFDSEMKGYEAERDAVEQKHKEDIDGIEASKQRSAGAHSARLSELDAQLARAKKVTDQALERINAEKQASQEATNRKIEGLQDLTPAEKALKKIELAKLRMQANDAAASQEERLQARARLERMEREEQIAKLQFSEKKRQARLDKESAELTENQAKREQAIAQEKERLGIEEEARQQRMADAIESLNLKRETSIANIAKKEADADARQEQRMARLDQREASATSARESAISSLDAQQEAADNNRESALEAFDDQAATVEANREAALANLEEAEATANENRESRLNTIEEKEKAIQEEKKERMGDLEEKEKTLQDNKKNRLDELEEKRKQQKRNEEGRMQATETAEQNYQDTLKDNIRAIEDERDKQLENFKARIDAQKTKLDEIKTKREDIDRAVDINELSEKDYQEVLDATKEKLDANLGVLRDMATETQTIADNLASARSDYDSIGTGDSAAGSTDGSGDGGDDGTSPTDGDNDLYDKIDYNLDEDPELMGGIENATFDGDSEVTVDGVENPWEVERAEIKNAEITFVDPDTGLSTTMPADGFGYFHGGPIQAGKRTVVNEFGKEGFMDARTGRMKQINAPAFGKWTAPSKGTVIPAHIWKSLKRSKSQSQWQESRIADSVPMDTSSSSSNGGGISSLGSSVMAAVMAASGGGDQFNNNITIQSQNPTKSAGDMMVAMARMRHRR